MTKRMLIDATHREETRVAVVDGNWLVDFDYESKYRKQLKGNIYLAKVTRVEPSLQAAFVNFGGNRHGFLPFNEIHPDYFRLPIADREALLAEQEEEMQAMREREEAEENAIDNGNGEAGEPEEKSDSDQRDGESDTDNEADAESGDTDSGDTDNDEQDAPSGRKGKKGGKKGRANADNKNVDTVGGDDVESDRPPRPSIKRNYKIQEVIKRGQIMLVQVQKEERGNKGAAVSSYLSLPGRYCVLMPNSPRSGGVSRKVASVKDRKRMREILRELNVPEGMSVIMRTAGLSRNKSEIKRDLDYLMRLWDSIRDLTLKSTAPTLVYEEGNLIKRAIRDLYKRDIEEIQVAGDEGYKEAKNFIKMLVPSHAKRVKHYRDEKIPLFHRYQVESQISEMGNTEVTLQSGGYLVINPTEALVSVDVNSGRATKERNIEETALKTNLEAAEEVARQLRLRDLGGLVVIDFIDMDDRRNNTKVEKRLRDALSNDRARIQVGKISNFGLLELSRQRLNPSLTEAQFQACEHCQGTGHIRTTDSAAILALRALEEEGIHERADQVIMHLPNEIALYILNNKRDMLVEIEQRYGFRVSIRVNEELSAAEHVIEPVKHPAGDAEEPGEVVDGSGIDLADHDNTPAKAQPRKSGSRDDKGKKDSKGDKGDKSGDSAKSDQGDDKTDSKGQGGARRRGRRGGRRRNRRNDQQGDQADSEAQNQPQEDRNSVDSQSQASEPEANDGQDAQTSASGKESDSNSNSDRKSNTAGENKKSGSAKSSSKSSSKSSAKSADSKSSSAKSSAKSTGAKSNSGGKNTSKSSGGSSAKSGSGKSGTTKKTGTQQNASSAETGDDNDAKTGAAEPEAAEAQLSTAPADTGAQPAEPDNHPSNDDAQDTGDAAPAEGAQNKSKPKKKGWWNRLIES